MWELLITLGISIFRFLTATAKRQWGHRKNPKHIVSKGNALSELKDMRDRLNDIIAKQEGK